jgi:serine-threonine kinase receptor-associated protein
MIKAIPLTCTGHSRPVTHLSFSGKLSAANGSYLMVSGCKDGNPMLRNGVSGDWIGTFLGHKGAIWCSRLSEDGCRAITASADFSVNIWDTSTGEVLCSLPHGHIVRSCDFSPDSRQVVVDRIRVVTAGQEKIVRIWDTKLGTPPVVSKEWIAGESPVRTVLWIEDNIVLSASYGGEFIWWDISSDEPIATKRINITGEIGQVERDKEWVVAAAGTSMCILDVTTGEVVKRMDLNYNVSAIGISKDRTKFLTGCSADTWVRLHDLETGELLDTSKGHHGPVHVIGYSPDGCLVATGSEDGTIRLWKAVTGPYGLWR